jgi:hypothetical protein
VTHPKSNPAILAPAWNPLVWAVLIMNSSHSLNLTFPVAGCVGVGLDVDVVEVTIVLAFVALVTGLAVEVAK